MRHAFAAAAPGRLFRIFAALPLHRLRPGPRVLHPIGQHELEALRRGVDDLPAHLRDFGAAAEIFRLPR